jgi:CheY-like chemotaxis protein
MTILIVEDDSFKYSEIEKFLINNGIDQGNIYSTISVVDTVSYLNENTPDKIILDMSLPSHQTEQGEGSPIAMPSGGVEILMELYFLNKNDIPIIILTQFPQIQIDNDDYSIDEAAAVIKEKYKFTSLIVDSFDNEEKQWQLSTKRFLTQ